MEINHDQEILNHSESYLNSYPDEVGENEDGEMEYIGTQKEWDNFDKLN